ncbi:MAG TPA: methylated-DNA--[protein]-cysteine S-methyltransferase [Firmicutes bacterium]|jgi:AraC family transcriptional regulator of adaptative response/methylated-DNA-[protein]-cysteine methyltransferase|nr:methylated-DNA--[protein]-cysteine S-methyltransferase [Bacillota bacterium]HOQ24539.1 methylated-DNA--[protein]-cysteine S-methyltransferase [Bacillota bacterium]HPT67804.1 methylated-DNA--[protein]-cysteine S-methyltransferase [Bacillota bacterium]
MISYTTTATPLGLMLLARTKRGVCALVWGDTEAELLAFLSKAYPGATIQRDDLALQGFVMPIGEYFAGKRRELALPLDFRASAFQDRVYKVLQSIPYGSTRSYQEVAQALGHPEACRAVANACARNNISLLIPCHRVVRKDGSLGGYQWGLERKQALLALEQAGLRKERPKLFGGRG